MVREAWFFECSDFFIRWSLREGCVVVHVLRWDGSETMHTADSPSKVRDLGSLKIDVI
jgi:hypothetical protein